MTSSSSSIHLNRLRSMLRSSIDAHRYGKSTSATAFLNTYTNKIKISTTTTEKEEEIYFFWWKTNY